MQVMYNSRVHKDGKPHIVGTHSGTPRIWLVQVWPEGFGHSLLFRPKGKVYISDLATLIDAHLRKEGISGDTEIRWIATAR